MGPKFGNKFGKYVILQIAIKSTTKTQQLEYYQNKFGDKFPEHYYKLMEILTRPEYDDPEEVIRIVEQVRTDAKLENERIINEWNERQLQEEEEDVKPVKKTTKKKTTTTTNKKKPIQPIQKEKPEYTTC